MPDPAVYGLLVLAALVLQMTGPAVLYVVSIAFPRQFVDPKAGATGLR